MDEVRARRALQRVAYTEDWLEKLKDDLAAGHARSAMTHLITAQAELQLLSEQLAPELGWAADPAMEAAPAMSMAMAAPVFALPGVPRRSPLAWASLAVAAIAVVLYTGVLVPRPSSQTTPIQPVTEFGDPSATLAALPALPAPSFPAPAPAAVEAGTPDLALADPTTVAEAPTAADIPRAAPPRRIRTRRPQAEPVATTTPITSPDPLPAATVPTSADPGADLLAAATLPANDVSLEAFLAAREANSR